MAFYFTHYLLDRFHGNISKLEHFPELIGILPIA